MSDLDTLYDRNEEFPRTFDQGDLPIWLKEISDSPMRCR